MLWALGIVNVSAAFVNVFFDTIMCTYFVGWETKSFPMGGKLLASHPGMSSLLLLTFLQGSNELIPEFGPLALQLRPRPFYWRRRGGRRRLGGNRHCFWCWRIVHDCFQNNTLLGTSETTAAIDVGA